MFVKDPVLLFCSSTSQQCFPLTPLQQQPPATSQPAVFFSHTTPAAASSTSTANRARKKLLWARWGWCGADVVGWCHRGGPRFCCACQGCSRAAGVVLTWWNGTVETNTMFGCSAPAPVNNIFVAHQISTSHQLQPSEQSAYQQDVFHVCI